MGLFSGITKSLAERKTKSPYKPSKQYLSDYEFWQRGDLGSLFRDTPNPKYPWAGAGYEGPGLGFSEAEMEGKFGEGRDLSAGAARASRQRLSDFYTSPGGLGKSSAMYGRALQRESLAEVTRANELRRRMIVENAQQKRADKLARLAAVGQAFGQGVDIYNQYASGFNRRIRNQYAGAGEAGDAILRAGSMGSF